MKTQNIELTYSFFITCEIVEETEPTEEEDEEVVVLG